MKFKLLFFIIIMILFTSVLFITSCKKYESGPEFSVMTKKARLVNQWKLSEQYINGIKQKTDTIEEILDIKRNETYILTSEGKTYTGKWVFYSDKEMLAFAQDNFGIAYTYIILRLKNDELWIKNIYLSNVREFRYKKR